MVSSRLAACSVLAVSLASACARPRPPVAPAPDVAATPAEIVVAATRVLARYAEAHQARDAAAVAALYAPNPTTVVVAQGRVVRGFSAIEAERAAFLGRVSQLRLRLGEPEVTAIGADGAALSAALEREYSDGPVTVVETGTLTLTLVRTGEAWLIVAEHFSYSLR